MKTRTAIFPLRLPLSLRAAIKKLSAHDGTSMNQFLVVAAAEKLTAMQAETFFSESRARSDRDAFLRILNRCGGEPPRADDVWETSEGSER